MIHFLLDEAASWIVRGAAFVVQRVPLETGLAWSRAVSTFIYFFDKRRRIAYANLKAAFPQSTARDRKRWAKEMFRHLGMSAIEILRFPLLKEKDLPPLVTFHGYENYLPLRAQGNPVILLTAHLGNWEFSQIVEAIRGRPLAVLARRQKYRRLDQLLNSFRQCQGSISLPKGAGVRGLIRELQKGGTVGMLGDQSGGDGGVWVKFFGRLTTSPRGPVALAMKTGAALLPVFCVRGKKESYHDVFMEPPILLARTGDPERDIQVNMETYLHRLEEYLTKYPGQWLWGHKRWKRTRTKRITILSDGKLGHVKQSEALAKILFGQAELKKPPYEMKIEKIEVQFRSEWHRKFFPLYSLFFIPWAQGRLGRLRAFFTQESLEKIERTNPDVVISAGSSLAPLNLCLSKENVAKSVVVMKPGFPFNLFRYDLAVIPAHDRGLMPRGELRIQGALSGVDVEALKIAGRSLARSIRNPERIRLSLFLGGATKDFEPASQDVENLLKELEKISQKLGGDYLITTSRRTPEAVNQLLEERIREFPGCQLCVIASKDTRAEVMPGMMALADYLIVTEDSISMIAEALSSGKKVVVVKMKKNGLASKRRRFREGLEQWGVPVVEPDRLSEILTNGRENRAQDRMNEERKKIAEGLESLL